jgi:hypothetical protein
LFGDDIMIEKVQTKKNALKGRNNGPKRKASMSETFSSVSEERTQTESDSQITKSSRTKSCTVKTMAEKKRKPPKEIPPEPEEKRGSKSNDACSFPKTLNY